MTVARSSKAIKEEPSEPLWTEKQLLSAALQLGAAGVAGWSEQEQELAQQADPVADKKKISSLRDQIREGQDPLGTLFGQIRSPEQRRDLGATYTPPGIVKAMLKWAQERPTPARVIDPGVGSARFLLEAAAAFPKAQLVGLEIDPLAAILARANLAASGLAKRSQIVLQDYREGLAPIDGRSLFIGNPPYVRHHQIGAKWKAWLAAKAAGLGLEASQLAGLHVHFFLATVLNAKPGDSGALITAAEWLDVNYGRLVRELFLSKLGGQGVVVVEPTAAPFPDAATTAAITFFDIGSKPDSIRLRRVKRLSDLKDLSGGKEVRRERLEAESRWSRLTHGARECPDGFVELGELCRVHRGQVTGANKIWISGEHTGGLPERVLFPTITKARELISAGKVLQDATGLRSVVDLPENLDEFDGADKKAIERFLRLARKDGAHSGYIASHRKAWWSVGLRKPAPVLATYMARRAPVFTRNLVSARHINIAHGLYPREPLNDDMLRALVDYLTTGISVIDGRTYAGGLTKFEPGEMERLFVPGPTLLATWEGTTPQ
ncbi:N-6 DNA methylase [Variovorax sp. EL159]|uniref:N-6 DNA methylase n=1 Tax=Variovorax sp. EL159 TaxID=1566270 RepID=UPI000886960E|nr:N-6 DNA methylase [Variovorax sp. EL159]SCX72643.1 Methyltransferase domain-containing protein [Variovorax sp. EL159]